MKGKLFYTIILIIFVSSIVVINGLAFSQYTNIPIYLSNINANTTYLNFITNLPYQTYNPNTFNYNLLQNYYNYNFWQNFPTYFQLSQDGPFAVLANTYCSSYYGYLQAKYGYYPYNFPICIYAPGVKPSVAKKDSDGDGVFDKQDGCPYDPNKTEPGICGCGQPDIDTDNDGIFDCNDNCPNDPNNDMDNDGICGNEDNCPMTFNPFQEDIDIDNHGDACDNCPYAYNPDQEDLESDGIGNACDLCPNDPLNDVDGDSICGDVDNCPEISNSDQKDIDNDGIGDACDPYFDFEGDGYANPDYPINPRLR